MNILDIQYQELLYDILDHGVEKTDRTGTGTISLFGRQIKHNMWEGFPLLTTKKIAWKSVVVELLWFLRGDTNIKYLIDNGCNIWNGDAYKRYERVWNWDLDEPLPIEEFIERIKTDDEFAKIWGNLGPIYGRQWREWQKVGEEVDQIQNLINELKTNPDSRRLMVSAWNVGDMGHMVLPPCHYGFQIYTQKIPQHNRERMLREKMGETNYQNAVDDCVPFGGGLSEYYDSYKIPERSISLMWNQRSVDTFLGLPFNIASYGLLLEIIAKEVNMIPDQLIGNLGDVHLYKNHIEQAREQLARSPFALPKLKINGDDPSIIEKTEYWKYDDFIIEGYQSHPTIKAPLSN